MAAFTRKYLSTAALFGMFLIFGAAGLLIYVFYGIPEQDFYGLAGVDPDSLSDAVAELDKSVAAVASLYPDASDKETILAALHPLNFLKSLPALEKSRRKFAAEPSMFNRIIYKKNLLRTSFLYGSDLEKYAAAVDALPREEGETYSFIENSFSFDDFLFNIGKLRDNSRILARMIIKGQAAEPLFEKAWEESPFEKAIAPADKVPLNMPILMSAVEVPTDCFGRPGQPDFFYLAKFKNLLVPLYADAMFYDISGEKSRHFKPLKDAGFGHYWQPDFNYYVCPDSGYQAEVLTLYRIRELLEGRRFSSEESAHFPELENAVKKFLSENPLRRSTQLGLFREIRKAKDFYPEIYALIIQKTGYFDNLIRRGAFINNNLVRLTPRLAEPLSLKELFVLRSYPSLYYQPFNRSVWLSSEPLQFGSSAARSPFYLYYSELKNKYGESELLKLMQMSFGLLKL